MGTAAEAIHRHLTGVSQGDDLAAAEMAARMANEAGWGEIELVQKANLYLALVYQFLDPSKVERVHKFMSYRFPDWTLREFQTSVHNLRDVIASPPACTIPP